ncbi:MAG TPA: TauD/TfdA family dioxygenase [Trebonia sp.]|nr:TauD/TfdA family dioxygenase [Trebonia sp.]
MTVIDVRKIAGHIGAEITGIAARPNLPPDEITVIRDALLEHKVVFLRGQRHLDDAAQAGFARRFGDLTTAHPTVPGTKDNPSVFELDAQRGGGKANAWHTDVTFVDRPPAISVLRAITLPPYGGDTSWANTVTAYESLSPALQALAEQLRALHSNDYDYAARSGGGVQEKSANDQRHFAEVFTSTVYQTEHPVVRVHPETGERSLLLGQFVRRLLGVSASDSRYLFDLFQQHVTRLENTVRWRWAPGDLAMWDNRATQHYAIDDYADLPRTMHRVTVAGDLAVGVDGSVSRAITGDSAAYAVPA